MGGATTRAIRGTLAGLLALGFGGGSSLAAGPPEPAEPEKRPVVEKIVDGINATIDATVNGKVGEKVDETLNEILVDAVGKQAVANIDEGHEDQARFIGELFEKLDRVFGEQYVDDRERKVRVRAGLETTFNDDGESTDTKVKVSLRVPLPALKRRFNGFIDIGEDFSELGAVSDPNFSEGSSDFSIAAGVIRRIRDNVEAGIKLKAFSSGEVFSLHPFVRFDRQYGPMRYLFEQKVIWESDDTWNSVTDFDVDRRFGSGVFLRLRNRVDYPFEGSGASIAHGLITRRALYESNGLSFELWLEYNTDADDPDTIADDTIAYAQLRLRGRIWRSWLEYELRPIYTVPIATDRDAFFSFLVSLAVVWDSYLGGGNGDKN